MPYVAPEDRDALEPHPAMHADDVGALNFQLTSLIDEWLCGDVRYESINAAIGVLECAKLELYRRIAAPYEDKKCRLNGDVYRSAAAATRAFGRLGDVPTEKPSLREAFDAAIAENAAELAKGLDGITRGAR